MVAALSEILFIQLIQEIDLLIIQEYYCWCLLLNFFFIVAISVHCFLFLSPAVLRQQKNP